MTRGYHISCSATNSPSALCVPAPGRRTVQFLWNCHCPGPWNTVGLIWRIDPGKQSLQSCCAAMAELAENLCVIVLTGEFRAVFALGHELRAVLVLIRVQVLHIF